MSAHRSNRLSEEDCSVAREAADIAVRKTFAILGVDLDSPKEVDAFRMDLRFAGELRLAAKESRKTVFRIALTILLTAIVGTAWVGLQTKLGVGSK